MHVVEIFTWKWVFKGKTAPARWEVHLCDSELGAMNALKLWQSNKQILQAVIYNPLMCLWCYCCTCVSVTVYVCVFCPVS